MHLLRKKPFFSILKVAQKLKQKQGIRIRMEESIVSVHMDYTNEIHTYSSNTDFSSKNYVSKKKKLAEGSAHRNSKYVKNITKGVEKTTIQNGKKYAELSNLERR